MIKTLTAFTEEIDDRDAAVSEVLTQLDLAHNQRKNSVALVHCYTDFVTEGVVAALSEALAFPLVGCTGLTFSSPEGKGQIALTVSVLTSDDIEFVVGVSSPVHDFASMDTAVVGLYDKLIRPLPQKPALFIPFVPFLTTVGGDEFIGKLNSLNDDIPSFGAVGFSDNPHYEEIYTFFNDEYFCSSLVLLALVGAVKPQFFQVSVPEEDIVRQKALVTASDHNVLQKVNNNPTVEFFKTLGFFNDDDFKALASLSLVFDQDDGARQYRACIMPTDDGSLVLCGNAPVNSNLSFAIMSLENVIEGAYDIARTVKAVAHDRGVLAYACAARSWALGLNDMAEHEAFHEVLGTQIPYQVVYVGGEIYPTRLSDGSAASFLQNDSLIICVL